MKLWSAYYLTPFVASSHTVEKVRGIGVGRRMYILAAQRLAVTGRVLSESGLQSVLAQNLWGRLGDDPTVPTATMVKVIPGTGKRQEFNVIDFRQVNR